MPLFPKIGL
jgi:hypothetical protein